MIYAIPIIWVAQAACTQFITNIFENKKRKLQMKTMIDKHIADTIMLASKYPAIKRVGVFGSYARGESGQNSDIDLLYDYDDSDERSTDDLLSYIEEINDILISDTKVSKVDYVWYKGVMESDNLSFKNAVMRDVEWLYQ
jgi:predicted nucleotidyltransferase